jgi:hypothetical protein
VHALKFLVHNLHEAAFKDVPEIFEVIIRENRFKAHALIRISAQVELGESLIARTEALGALHSNPQPPSIIEILSATFRELGPPDLCHVVKSTARAGQRDVSANLVLAPVQKHESS